MRYGIYIFLLVVSQGLKAGDIATERTQVATATIVEFIRQANEAIQKLETEISQLENKAALLVKDLPGSEAMPGVEDVFLVLTSLEQIVREGDALAHTYDGLEEFMEKRFDTYNTYLNIISDQWGELNEGAMREKFQVWNQTHMDTITQTLVAHGIHAHQIDSAEARLATLQELSRNAQGRMQAIQIGQEIATEEIKQLHQLKEIIMEQSNLHASYFAVRQAMQSEKEAVNTWIQREINPTIVGNEQGLPLP